MSYACNLYTIIIASYLARTDITLYILFTFSEKNISVHLNIFRSVKHCGKLYCLNEASKAVLCENTQLTLYCWNYDTV